jgi:hypothetical protein
VGSDETFNLTILASLIIYPDISGYKECTMARLKQIAPIDIPHISFNVVTTGRSVLPVIRTWHWVMRESKMMLSALTIDG